MCLFYAGEESERGDEGVPGGSGQMGGKINTMLVLLFGYYYKSCFYAFRLIRSTEKQEIKRLQK